MGYFIGRTRGYGGWAYRSGPRYGFLETKAQAPGGEG
jgi:hypothetical protein